MTARSLGRAASEGSGSTMPVHYEFSRYRPEFRSQIVALLTHLWPDEALTDAYFAWKHEQNPYVDEPMVYVALAQGKVVGMRAFHGARWRYGPGAEDSFAAPCACDLLIDPAHRDPGLFQNIMQYPLTDMAARGYRWAFSLSAIPVTYLSNLRTGWRLVGPYETLRRGTWQAKALRNLKRRAPALSSMLQGDESPFSALDDIGRMESHVGALSVSREPQPEAMAGVARAADPTRLRHERSAAYFAWRFGNPLHDYRFVYWHDPELRGFLVLQARRGHASANVNVVDWEADQPETLGRLLHSVVQLGQFKSLSMWSATLSREAADSLKDLGFVTMDEGRGVPGYRPGLLVKRLAGGADSAGAGPSESRIHSLAEWDLRMAYSDSY